MRTFRYAYIAAATCLGITACQRDIGQPYESRDFVGTWKCGPTPMYGRGFKITLLTMTVRSADGRFSSRIKAEVDENGKEPVVSIDVIEGNWTLDGDVLTETINSSEFVSSTDQSMTKEAHQARARMQLEKRRVYPNRVLKFEVERVTTIPIDGDYKEAEVELVCKRA